MPTAPNVEGLPLSLQAIVSITFAICLAWATYRKYQNTIEREPPGAATTVLASIPDMTAVRQLTDECRLLRASVESLRSANREMESALEASNRVWSEHTHWLRNKIEVDQELCQRMRELKEEIARSDRQKAARQRRSTS